MPSRPSPLSAVLLLLGFLVASGTYGSLASAVPEDGLRSHEVGGMASSGREDHCPAQLERFEVIPREDPPTLGTSVAIRAHVDKGGMDAPVDLHVTVHHEEGRTPVPSTVYGGEDTALATAYWDAQSPGPYLVDATVTVGEVALDAPQERGYIHSTQATEENDWVLYLVEGSLLWGLVLTGLALASQWARGRDGSRGNGG